MKAREKDEGNGEGFKRRGAYAISKEGYIGERVFVCKKGS